MNHSGHVIGGIIAGGGICFLASITGDVEIGWEILGEIKDSPCLQLKTPRLWWDYL